MEREHIGLFELQTMLKSGIESIFPSRIWLRAEISALKSRPGGHCYMELSEMDDKGLTAKAQAVIWNSKFRFIAPYFESVTGTPLAEGMTVLLEVQISYSQLYGLSLVVDDIDPAYTAGEGELARRKTVERLKAEGLFDMQQGLEIPRLPYSLAIISASDAAGYRDFMKHLHGNEYGFAFETDLFPALMQGAGCPASIIGAMHEVVDSGKEYDALLIVRGGGAKLDLSCYDDYDLAANVAQFPLPVFVAVGHDQDFHICDMTARLSVKTPTALADELIDMYADEDALLASYASKLKLAFSNKVSSMENRLQLLQTRIAGADPRNILKRGYVLALDGNGVVMKRAAGKSPGDRMSVVFRDGMIDCEIKEVSIKDERNNG